jgi:Protein of unknown function (DUF2786)/SprT-like family
LDKLSDIYRLWGQQLFHEFHTICCFYSLSLKPPIFSITKSRSEYGSWWPDNREIKISGFLIRNHSWDVTLQVLKHEIAHQICSEIFQEQEQEHGVKFIKACEMLGLPEPFRHSRGDLPESIDGPKEATASHRIIEKIRKLLALAESSNDHEARLAMETAGRLLKKHNLRELGKETEKNYVYAIINRKRKRIEEHQRRIVKILTQFFYVKALCSSMYDPLENETYKTFEIFGKKENVEIAKYCYHFLEQKLALLWQCHHMKCRGNKRLAKKSYYLGLLQGFHDKLLDQEKNATKCDRPGELRSLTESELIIAGDSELDRFVRARYPRLAKRSGRGVKIYKEIFNTGVDAGRDLVFHKAIRSNTGNVGNLLE